jgi:hypothetical protein
MWLAMISVLGSALFSLTTAWLVFRTYRAGSKKKTKEYTRERFAFKAALLVIGLCSTVVSSFLAGPDLLGVVATWLELDLSEVQPSISDKLLALVVLLIVVWFVVRLHKNWQGPISVREHEAALLGIKPGILSGSLLALSTYVGRSKLDIYEPSRRSRDADFVPSPSATYAWHSWVARILQLSSNQFHIDEVGDWHAEEQVFVSSYGKDRQSIGILCSASEPSKSELQKAKKFIETQAGKVSRIIVAIESVSSTAKHSRVDGTDFEFRYRDELLESLVDFDSYRESIRFRWEDVEIAEGYQLKLPDVYVPSSGWTSGQNAQSIENIEEYALKWAKEKTLMHIALLGEYGQGKSVLALRLTYSLLFKDQIESRIPILITMGGRSPRNQSKLSLLADWAAPFGINPQALLALQEAGRLILIFDGFDEMDLVGQAALRFDHFRAIWDFSRDRDSKILITGRPNFFLDQIEREAALNIRARSTEVPYTVPVYVKAFSDQQITQALRSFKPGIRDEICAMLGKPNTPQSFRDLIGRPSTLFLAATIWGELRDRDEPAISDSAEVIQRFISHSFDRQQRKGLNSFLSSSEREYFTVGVSIGMIRQSQFSNHITREQLERIVARLLDKFPEDLTRYEAATSLPRIDLKQRLHDRQMLLETISSDVRACGILVSDLSRPDSFKFAHKSFFEVLVAKHVVYTSIRKPIGREVILHQAVRRAIQESALFAQIIYPGRLSDEMFRFAGQILCREVIGNVSTGMSLKDFPYSRFRERGIPVRKILTIGSLLSTRWMEFFGMYLHPLLLASWPLNIYLVIFYLLEHCGIPMRQNPLSGLVVYRKKLFVSGATSQPIEGEEAKDRSNWTSQAYSKLLVR